MTMRVLEQFLAAKVGTLSITGPNYSAGEICRIRGAGGFSSGVVHSRGGVVEAVAVAAAGALVGMAVRSTGLNLRYH